MQAGVAKNSDCTQAVEAALELLAHVTSDPWSSPPPPPPHPTLAPPTPPSKYAWYGKAALDMEQSRVVLQPDPA